MDLATGRLVAKAELKEVRGDNLNGRELKGFTEYILYLPRSG